MNHSRVPTAAGRALLAGAALLVMLRSGALQAAAPEDLEPGVQTSSAAAPTAGASTGAGPAVGAPAGNAAGNAAGKPAARAGGRAAGKPAAGVAQPGAAGGTAGNGTVPATRAGAAHDRVELDTTQITGNRELPNVMYVVPWKKPELGDFGGRPPKSLLDELLSPVDRDVFRRQNRYYSALKGGAAAGQGAGAGTGAGGTAPGAAPAVPVAPAAVPNAVDEK